MQVQELLRARATHTAIEEEKAALKGADFLPEDAVANCSTYRAAVWLAWENRRHRGMTKSRLAEVCDLYAPHVTHFVNPLAQDGKGKRRADLPAEKISAFEAAVGNRAVSQWLSRRARLTIMEEMIAARS
ncbi:XRE family transcriptional regulator [Robbsia sp. KACC 23696]|uniref:XRE family transcriptional regulator n=1 Tax=Robbsia sp. KACC 23696 TaxID=3149231 RepID=UPI00325B4F25